MSTSREQFEGDALISRLTEVRNFLSLAAQYIHEANARDHGHRAANELDDAVVLITVAIEALQFDPYR